MHIRPFVPMGLALFVSTGCQSYFPYGYGNAGPYPPVSQGTYSSQGSGTPSLGAPSATIQQGTGQYQTSPNGQKNMTSGQPRSQSPKNQKLVPDPRDAGGAPANLGASGSDDDGVDGIRRPASSQNGPAKRIDEGVDDSEESLSSADDERFVSPVSASSDDLEVRGPASKPRPSPYKKDPIGYSWLRGVVARDQKNNSWRITYSRDPLDGDQYGGSLTLVDDEILDMLIDGDVVLIQGKIDRTVVDRYGKPSYRATSVDPLKAK